MIGVDSCICLPCMCVLFLDFSFLFGLLASGKTKVFFQSCRSGDEMQGKGVVYGL